ncbi:polysaccharide deacetylase family protein [Streptomyces sp. NPDC001635]
MVWRGSWGRHGQVIATVIGVTAVAAAASVWTAQVGPSNGQRPRVSVSEHSPSTATSRDRRPAPVSPDIVHASDAGAQGINITIDDGPDPVWTPQILQVLRDNGAKAIFCMIGPQAQAHPELVKAVVAAGHRLCDHAVSHDTAMDTKSESYQAQEILDAARMITQASGGIRPQYYRAPGGAFTPYSRQLAASHGMRPLGWNSDSRDWERPGISAIVATVKKEVSNGPTVLFHDGGGDRSETVDALRQLLPWLKQQGYSFGFPVR